MDNDESQLCFRCVQTLETSAPEGLECVFTVSPLGCLAVEVTVFAASSWRQRI